MPGLVRPHGGGSLKPLMLAGEVLAAERNRARSLHTLRVSSREKGDLIMLGIGGFTPLDGFMTRADWQGVCRDARRVRAARLVARGGVPDAQSDASLARVPGEGGDRNL